MSTARSAEAYCSRFGLSLVPLPPRTKRPLAEDWGNQVISDPGAAARFYTENPDWNIGVALFHSRLCSFDVDDIEATRQVFEEFGWDLDQLRASYPTIQGSPGGFRVMFRVPDGIDLPFHKLHWPRKDDPRRVSVVWELRASKGQQLQDVLPPSIHPDTGRPYVWLTRPSNGFLEPPDWLLKLWQNWDALKPQIEAVCPWAPKPKPRPQRQPREHTGESVIDAYDEAHDLEASLTHYGYKKQGRRWLSPHSGTGLPGVTILDDGKCWIHHASDPLCSNASGQPVAPFDLFCCYEHGGDTRKAVKAAAELMGMERRAPATQAGVPAAEAPSLPEPPPEAVALPAIQPPKAPSCDVMAELPHMRGKRVLATIENLQEICRRLGVVIRYNVIAKEEEILIPGVSFTRDNRANARLAWLSSWCERLGMATGKLGDYVTFLADGNLFNPVARWIESKPWDGQSRLQDLFDTVSVEGGEQANRMKEAFMRRWLISAVAAAFESDGVSARGVLVFQGEQYIGKTQWFKSLAPADLGVVQDGMLLRPEDKDSVKQIVSHWLVELGELDATFRKADIAQLKSFIPRKRDILRRAYARRESEFARRTVFFASVNPKEFLHDPTGNSRYWTLECTAIDHAHGIDMQQLWAEVLCLYRAGEPWFLQEEEFQGLTEHNKDFEIVDPIEELIINGLRWNDPVATWRWRSATEVLRELGRDTPSKADATQAAHIIRNKNGKRSRKTNGARSLLVPERWNRHDSP